MTNVAGLQLLGGPFAVWAATMQAMPGGVLDAGFGRYFVGLRLSNGSSAAWPVTHVRLSRRSRQQLVNAGIVIEDGWSVSDGLAFDQQVSGDRVIVPALTAAANRAVFFKMDASGAHPGVHDLEVELFDPAVPATVLNARAALRVASTVFDNQALSFVTTADKGTLTTSLAKAAFDVEALRRALGAARAAFPGGAASDGSTSSQIDRLRQRLHDFVCGNTQDICDILADIGSFCALPQTPLVPPAVPTGLDGFAVFGALAANISDRLKVDFGNAGGNFNLQTGVDCAFASDILAGCDVTLRDRSVVSGKVRAGGVVKLVGMAKVLGTITEHASYTAITIPTKTVTPGSTAVSVTTGSKALAPGAYGIVSTTGKVTLSFVAGVYQLKRLVLGPDVTLAFDVSGGVIDIRVQELLSFGDRAAFTVSGGSAAGRIQFYSDESDEVKVGANITNFTGSLSVPKGTIHVFSGTTVFGNLWASTLVTDSDVSVSLLQPGTSWLGTGASGFELLAFPTAFDYTLDYAVGYSGTNGPQAYDGLPWKSLFANVNLMFNLSLGGALASSLASTAGSLVIGKVTASVLNAAATAPSQNPPVTQVGSVDAATLSLAGNRALGSSPFGLLDVQTGEANAQAISGLDARITLPGGYLKNTETSALLAAAATDPAGLQVYKSGAGTGVTRGLLSALLPVFKRTDPAGALYFLNQLSIIPDPAFTTADNQVASAGDSGALWIHARTGKIIALGHATSSAGSAVASRIEDVVSTLKVQFA